MQLAGLTEGVRPGEERERAVVRLEREDWWIALTFETMLPWLSITPFGIPVVPEV